MSDREVYMNGLQLLAIELAERDVDHAELRENDVTELYYYEKQNMLERDELMNGQFHGLPGSGKSTAMIAEVVDTNNRISVIFNKKCETTPDHILPNQIIYAQIMRRFHKRQDICIGIDEFDKMGDTGYNATTDNAILEHYSDLHRAHYIHKYACAPKDQVDKNSFLVFEVQAADKEQKFTRCLLYYKLFIGGFETNQLLGYVDIDVAHVLELPLMKEYERRKMARLNMIGEHGIQNDRDIIFGELVLEAYHKLSTLTSMGSVDSDLIELRLEMAARNNKQINSLLASRKLVGNVSALLKYDVKIEKLKRQLLQRKKQAEKDSSANLAVTTLSTHLEEICRDREESIKYWENAAGLKDLFFSNIGLEAET